MEIFWFWFLLSDSHWAQFQWCLAFYFLFLYHRLHDLLYQPFLQVLTVSPQISHFCQNFNTRIYAWFFFIIYNSLPKWSFTPCICTSLIQSVFCVFFKLVDCFINSIFIYLFWSSLSLLNILCIWSFFCSFHFFKHFNHLILELFETSSTSVLMRFWGMKKLGKHLVALVSQMPIVFCAESWRSVKVEKLCLNSEPSLISVYLPVMGYVSALLMYSNYSV